MTPCCPLSDNFARLGRKRKTSSVFDDLSGISLVTHWRGDRRRAFPLIIQVFGQRDSSGALTRIHDRGHEDHLMRRRLLTLLLAALAAITMAMPLWAALGSERNRFNDRTPNPAGAPHEPGYAPCCRGGDSGAHRHHADWPCLCRPTHQLTSLAPQQFCSCRLLGSQHQVGFRPSDAMRRSRPRVVRRWWCLLDGAAARPSTWMLRGVQYAAREMPGESSRIIAGEHREQWLQLPSTAADPAPAA